MSSIIRIAFVAAMLSAGLAGEAAARTFKTIAGKWCGLTTNYMFAPNQLTVSFHDGSPTRKFKVTRYEYVDGTVKMHGSGQQGRRSHRLQRR